MPRKSLYYSKVFDTLLVVTLLYLLLLLPLLPAYRYLEQTNKNTDDLSDDDYNNEDNRIRFQLEARDKQILGDV